MYKLEVEVPYVKKFKLPFYCTPVTGSFSMVRTIAWLFRTWLLCLAQLCFALRKSHPTSPCTWSSRTRLWSSSWMNLSASSAPAEAGTSRPKELEIQNLLPFLAENFLNFLTVWKNSTLLFFFKGSIGGIHSESQSISCGWCFESKSSWAFFFVKKID